MLRMEVGACPCSYLVVLLFFYFSWTSIILKDLFSFVMCISAEAKYYCFGFLLRFYCLIASKKRQVSGLGHEWKYLRWLNKISCHFLVLLYALQLIMACNLCVNWLLISLKKLPRNFITNLGWKCVYKVANCNVLYVPKMPSTN